jgi:N4-gp56 family major capsid protein
MARTLVGVGDAKAVKRWSLNTATDIAKKAYFERKFIGTDDNSVIHRKTELENDAGDEISFDLAVQLRGKPVYGDNRAAGNEESQKHYTDTVKIDQVRKPVSTGGRMTRKRTVNDLRANAKNRASDYFARFMDEMIFMYLSGARGINEDFIESTTWTGHAGNAFSQPDAAHWMFGGNATAFNNIDSADTMSRAVIEKAANKAVMLQARDKENARMVPVNIDGNQHFVVIMSPDQEYDLRNDTGTGGWLDLQKAAAGAEGRNNPIFKGSIGMLNNVVLHSHENVIRFNNAGASTNLNAARALFLGRQAGVIAYGTPGGLRYQWEEEPQDYGNEVGIAVGTIVGFKKTKFNGRDFSVLALDTYANPPA